MLNWEWSARRLGRVGRSRACQRLDAGGRYHLRYEVGGIFESAWSLRGFERSLLDLVEKPEVACAIMDRFTTSISNTRRVIEAAGGRLDMVYTYDDVGIEGWTADVGRMWRKYVHPATSGSMMPSLGRLPGRDHVRLLRCGLSADRAFVDDMGIDVLNPPPTAGRYGHGADQSEMATGLSFHGRWTSSTRYRMARGRGAGRSRERCALLGRGGGLSARRRTISSQSRGEYRGDLHDATGDTGILSNQAIQLSFSSA